MSEDATTATSPQSGENLGVSAAIDGTLALIGAPKFDGFIVEPFPDSGRVVVFSFNGSIWVQDDVLQAGDFDSDDQFGHSVAIDGNIAVVGALRADIRGLTDAGAAYVFELDGGSWTQVAKLTISSPAALDLFGESVAISGDTIIVSARGRKVDTTEDAGAVFWFDRPPGGWANAEGEEFFSEDVLNDFDRFGFSVALDGDVAIVGAPLSFVLGEQFAGGAFIFRRNGSIWTQEDFLTAFDALANDKFGTSVSIDGNVALVGAPFHNHALIDDSGAAYVFRFDDVNNIWPEEQILSACNPLAHDELGTSVSISGNVAVVGAIQATGNGRADAFRFFGNGWAPVNQLTALDGGQFDRFGSSVSVDGERAIVGAFAWDDGGTGNEGAMYGFDGLDSAAVCDCPADLNGDCEVGVKDLLIFLGSWGPCPPNEDCPADFDDSGDVGVIDLLFLLGSWGPCPCNPGAVVLSLQEELDDACLTMDDWDEYVDVITDPESSQEDKDRYDCWMDHYLDNCNKCTCEHVVLCPIPDPFG